MKNVIAIFSLLFLITHQSYSQVVINEFSAANRGQFFDQFGQDEDWIELYNMSSSSFDLSGHFLSDRASNPDKWEFPSGTIINGNDYLLIWASGRDLADHTNFKITQTKNNEAVVFSDPSGTIIDINEIDVPNQLGDSWARELDGSGDWAVAFNPTPGDPNGTTLPRYASKVNVIPASGAKTGPIEISIEADDLQNGTIYYTLDGSAPNPSSSIVYNGPFTASSTTIVRARVFENNIRPGLIETNTYLIDENHSVPVVSIAGTELQDLLDGAFIDPIGSIEIFGRDGIKIDEAVGDYNKHGNDSWFYDQRGIDYITRDQYGYDSDIDGKLFNVSERTSFQRLMFKAAANDNVSFENGAHIRDAYVHTLSQLANLEMDERSYEPCVLYLNGQYWGVYEIREKVDDHDFTEFYYDQEREDIDFIKTWGATWEEYGSWDDWYDLRDYIENNDMADPDNYAYAGERFNFLSLIDYMILHSFNVSADWLNWNTAWWRGRNVDGGAKKWKYVLWDEDASFDHYINYSNVPTQDADADPCDFEEIGPFTDFEGHVGMFQKLFDNQDFIELYINRYADLNNTYLSCDYAVPLLDSLIAQLAPEMPRQLDRWGGTMNQWEDNVQQLRDFLETRCFVLDEGIVDCYEDEGITGPYNITINVSPDGAGRVKANTLIGLNYPWEGTYFGGISVELEAIPNGANNFLYWEVDNNVFGPSDMDALIEMQIDQDDVITAYFSDVPCIDPSNVIVNTAPGMAFLEWQGGGNVTYEVNYRLQGETDWDILSTLDNEIVLSDLMDCSQYEGRIRTICATTNTDYIDFEFSTWCTTNTNDLEAAGISDLKIYPVPFADKVTIELELAEASLQYVNVFDMKGGLVMKYSNVHYGNIIVLENWADYTSGIYQVQLITDKGVVTQKVIKI